MKKTLFFIAILCFANFAKAQDRGNETLMPGEKPFVMIEKKPKFPGGLDSLMQFISDNVKYPKNALLAGIEGKVIIQFVIDKDGSIIESKIARGIGGGCDEEALRVVNAMPKWEAGTINNVPVKVQYNLPINFYLDKPKK